jgi:hypothetical protein
MFQPDCPELSLLARLHWEKYNVRLKLLASDASKGDLIRAETDVVRISKQMTSHRRRCGHCNQAPTFSIVTPARPGRTGPI